MKKKKARNRDIVKYINNQHISLPGSCRNHELEDNANCKKQQKNNEEERG